MRKLGNNQLDKITANIVKASVLDPKATNAIADSPDLFYAVLRRVNTLPVEQPSPKTSIFSYRLLKGAVASAILVGAIAVSFGILNTKDKVVATAKPAESAPTIAKPIVETARPTTSSEPDRISVLSPTVRTTEISPVRVRASTREMNSRPRQSKPAQDETSSTIAEFYPLTYAGDPSETARGGRVIRVDMSRSSLFAMGVDLPLENESDSVKADLLVGPDGVARGIRIVK